MCSVWEQEKTEASHRHKKNNMKKIMRKAVRK